MSIALADIRGARETWAERTRREPVRVRHDQSGRMIFDLLGLGLEQAIQYLGQVTPSFEEFETWVIETAGAPDPDSVARYHAVLDGAPLPQAVRARLDAIDAAAPVLDAADLAHWDAQGYVILRGAITPDEARAAEELLWQVTGAKRDDPSTWYGLSPNGIMIQHFQDPALDAARRSPRVHKAFAQLWGTADLWATIDRMSFNPPHTPARPFRGPWLHWDVSLALPIPFATQGILYFTDTTADQGALQLVPGFHHRIEQWLADLGSADPRGIDLSAEATTVPAGAGDLIIWRQDLPHGASPNHTPRPRMAQYVNYYSPALTVNPEWR